MSNRRYGARWPLVSRDRYNRDMDDVNDELENERDRYDQVEEQNQDCQERLASERRRRQTIARRQEYEVRQAYQAGARAGAQQGYRAGSRAGQRRGYRYGQEDGYEQAQEDMEADRGFDQDYRGYQDRSSGAFGYRNSSHGTSGHGADSYDYRGRSHGYGGAESYGRFGSGVRYPRQYSGGYGRSSYQEYDDDDRSGGRQDADGRPSDYPYATNIPGDTRGRARGARQGTASNTRTEQAPMPGALERWHGRADTIRSSED